VALKNIRIFEDEGILEHVRAVTPHFQQRLHDLRKLPIVGDTRGMGLMGCVECVADANSQDPLALDYTVGGRIDVRCQELGLLVRPIVNMCVFSPPLIITADQIDEMFDLLEQGIRLATDDLTREGLWCGS
jgi:putrescine aminotransferase